jgi:hypothetical protein
MARRKGRTAIGGQFSWRLVEMLEAPAYRVLSLSARRILDRLEIELAHHGGDDNGRLPTTYEHFHEYGMDRDTIAPAISECVALGFVEVTERGRAGNREFRSPSLYRLTYRPTRGRDATDEWKNIGTLEQAQAVGRAARTTARAEKKRERKNTARGLSDVSHGGSPAEIIYLPHGGSPTTALHGGSPTTSISRGGERAGGS